MCYVISPRDNTTLQYETHKKLATGGNRKEKKNITNRAVTLQRDGLATPQREGTRKSRKVRFNVVTTVQHICDETFIGQIIDCILICCLAN